MYWVGRRIQPGVFQLPIGENRSTLKVLMNPISLFAGIQHRYAGALSSTTQGLN